VNVIIVYATKHGSTQGVAGAVADALRERGAQVTLRPARAVREPVAGYGLVVLGAALYSGRWHRDATGSLNAIAGSLPACRWRCLGWGHAATPRMPGSAPVPSLTGRWASIAG